MNTTDGFNLLDEDRVLYPTVKTVNGKPIGDDCVTCGTHMERGRWLCSKCSVAIGHKNINITVENMPEYLHNSQYEQWLKLKLSEFINGDK